ncbi:MAG: hypothetical protein LBG25_02205 [Spirochaetaceae bacterium]|nr:hypothetical protein [Spirochaetaceae bacterium]
MNRAANIIVFEAHHSIPEDIAEFGLEADDPFYGIIQDLLSEKKEKLAGAADQGKIQSRYHKLISAMTKTAKAQAQIQAEARLKALDLLAGTAAMDWYFAVRGYEPEAMDQAVFSDQGLEACLTQDVERTSRALLKARLALEIEGLSCFLGEAEGGDRAKLLPDFCLVNSADAAKILDALRELRLLLDAVEDSGSADYYAALENAAQSGELAAWFLRGGSCFVTQSGQLIVYGLLETEMTAAARSQGLLAVYQVVGLQAPAVARETGLRGLRELGELFTSYGLTLNNGGLPGMKSLGEALLRMEGSLPHNLSAFLSRMNEHLDSLPQWIKTEVQTWQFSLITYMAAKTIYNNRSITGSSGAIKNELEILMAQAQAAQLLADALSYAGPESAGFLNAALRLPPELFTAIDKTAIEDEAVKRIGRDLARQYGAEIMADETTLRDALTAACLVHHGYAEEGIRRKAVDAAMALLRSGPPDDEIPLDDSYYEIISGELPLIFNTLAGRQERLNFEYALVKAYEEINQQIKDAEGAGRRHWRQYVSAEFLEEYTSQQGSEGAAPAVWGDPEGTGKGIKTVKNWREGILADAFDRVSQDAQRLTYALRTFRNAGEQPEREFIRAGIKKYQDDPLLEWDETLVKTVDYMFYDNYSRESGEFQKNYILEASLRKEIEQLGIGYATTKQNSAGIKEEIKKISDEIVKLQDTCDRALALYERAASDFAGAGAAYDEVYRAVKKDYADLEEARAVYEREDAIRRWASTAYLDASGTGEITADYKTPYEDLSYSTSRYERAVTALSALAGLYEDDERRPYGDREYELLYHSYQESFQRMLLSIKTLGLLEESIAEEMRKNSAYYDRYNQYLRELGCSMDYSANYQPPGDKSLWQLMDVIQVKNNKLAFSYDSSFLIQTMSGGQAAALKNFFTPRENAGIEVNMVSQFEAALRQLNQNLIRYEVSADASKYNQWGLARDYLLSQLISNNTEINTMADWYSPAKALNAGENLGEMSLLYHGGSTKDTPIHNVAAFYRHKVLLPAQKNAWDQLSDEEKADLEFYTILTLLGDGGRDSKGFSYISAQNEYAYVNSLLNQERSRLKGKLWIPIARHFYKAGLARLNATRDHLLPSYQQIIDTVEKARTGLETTATALNASLDAYIDSCDKLARLNGTGTGTGNIRWNSIEQALQAAGGLTADEIQRLKRYWYNMEEDTKGSYRDTVTAIKELIRWSKNKKEDDKRNFEQAWIEDEQTRVKNETAYREVFAAFIEGKADSAALHKAAVAAYGDKAPARKNHLENLEQTIVRDLKGIMEDGAGYKTEYIGLADELTQLIKRAYTARYHAELTARELEWDMQRYDIQEKYRAWVEASSLILERGRTDWNAGAAKMQTAYAGWVKKFNEEYQAIDEAWIAAYLTGLEDKARWVTMATEAANSAASGALLALVGSEAEMMSRGMDTRLVSGMTLPNSAEEAGNTLGQLLQASGIVNMETAFAAAKGMTGTITSQVRRGMGGLTAWNSGTIQAAAFALAKETNEELAARETKRVAAAVQSAVKEALDNLTKNVAEGNKEFDETMDDVFIIEGQWRKNGRYYTKEAVVHSTLFDPVITETATVEGYEFYKMDPIELSTDLSEDRLRDLDALAVQALINNMYTEVQGIAEKIFGTEEENSGLFTRHIGEGPVVKPDVNADMSMDELFSDNGTGQLGKLLRLYIYWAIQERNGINAINSALWEKPLWDSRDSWFQAPSIRSVVDVGNQVVSAVVSTVVGAVAGAFSGGAGFALGVALNTAMNLSDDLFFSALDTSGNYKSWDEVGVEFGKKAAITAAGSLIGGVFNGAGAAASAASSGFLQSGISGMVTQNLTGLSKVITQAALTGAQSITTGTVTSALSAVTYNAQDGFGFSRDIFNSAMKGASIGALSGMTGSFTAGMMNWGLDGFYGQLHTDGTKLSFLAGGLAGQGVNYAFTGDYALNLFNLDLVSGGRVNSGLLELHLGRDGVTMGLGTDGVDVSAGTTLGALRGLEAWKVNARILASGEENPRQYAPQMRTLYSGDAVTRAEFEAVLEGRTRYQENRYAEGTESVYDEHTGIKTILLGRDALEEGSRFGLNVVFSHEAYRNGRDDGVYGQLLEGNNAVAGHIGVVMGLMETYGTDSVSAALQGEALWYRYALNQGDYSIIDTALGAYDSGRDFWQLTGTGGLRYDGSGYLRDVDGLYINYDGTKTVEPVKEGPGRTVGSSGIETGLLRILDLAPTEENITAIQDMMLQAGLTHTVDPGDPENRDLWMWKGTTAIAITNQNVTISNNLLRKFGMIHLPRSMFLGQGAISAAAIKDTAHQMSLKEEWQPQNGITNCNFVFLDTIEAVLGETDLTKALRNAGIANKIGLFLDENYHPLGSELMAQIASNMGYLVAASYINPGYLATGDNTAYHGHIGTVVANYGTYIPALGPRISQGGVKNGEYWLRDPNTFGRVINNTSYYALRAGMARAKN